MTRCRAMDWRPAAVYLLVACLGCSASLHFASRLFPDTGDAQERQPGVSAPAAEQALALGNKIESPCNPDLAPAVFPRPNSLQVFGRSGERRPLADDRPPSRSLEWATGIRGPPNQPPASAEA